MSDGAGRGGAVVEPTGTGDTSEFPAGWQPYRARRRWLGPLLIWVALIAVLAGAAGGARYWSQHRHDDEPIVSARRVVEPIAKRNEGGLRKQIDAEQAAGKPDAESKKILRFFRGWSIDASTVKVLHAADDNGYTFGFTAKRPTGTRARIHGSLWPQGKTGSGPWKLTGLWVDHGTRHKARMIS